MRLSAPKARILACALAAAFCLALAWGSAPTANAGVRPLLTGVSYVYENDLAAFEHVRRAGARIALTPLRWGSVAPKTRPDNFDPTDPAEPSYDWEEWDVWVRHAVQAGVTPVLQVRGAPLWAQRCSGTPDAPCKADPAALAQFATAAARRYSGNFGGLPRVRYWQGLNEPNLSLFFQPQFEDGKPVSAALYRQLINAFTPAIKAVDPTNIVIAGGLGPIAVPKYTIGPMQFTRELLCMKGAQKFKPLPGDCEGGVSFDIFDIHPYTTGGPTHQGRANDVQLGDLPKLRSLLDAADRAGRIHSSLGPRTPLWVTELAWDSKPPDPGGLPMKILRRWAAEALHNSWRVGVETFFWYSLRDSEPEPGVPSYETPQAGLYFRGPTVAHDAPKGVMFAFRFPFVAYPTKKGLKFWGRTPSSSAGKVRIQVLRKKRWHTVETVRADVAGIFKGRAGTRYGQNKRGAVRARFGKENSVPFSMRPVPDFAQPPFGAPS